MSTSSQITPSLTQNYGTTGTPSGYTLEFTDQQGIGIAVNMDSLSPEQMREIQRIITKPSTPQAASASSSSNISPPQPVFASSSNGVYTYPDGRQYQGPIERGLPNGRGTITSYSSTSDCKCYEGDVVNGRLHGTGTTTYKLSSRWVSYSGDYVDDRFEGEGRMDYRDGRYYEGQFKANQYHGRGFLKLTNGDSFTGTWVNGEFLEGHKRFRVPTKVRTAELTILEYRNGEPYFGPVCSCPDSCSIL